MPQDETSAFLTMAHMGDGIKIEYEILPDEPVKPIYRFVAGFIFEENKNRQVMLIPLVLVSQEGITRPVVWE